MTDRRVEPDPSLVDAFEPAQVARPLVDLLDRPDGARDRQLLFGDPVTILGGLDGHVYLRSDKDGYIGFVLQGSLTAPQEPTHAVCALATHAYAHPDMKSPDTATLSFGSRFAAISETEGFLECSLGFVPKQHVRASADRETSIADVALKFLGVPYLWGGNSRLGLDCSGLVQTALLACGYACPGDADQQRAAVGQDLPAQSPVLAGDLFFWPGHVAIALDTRNLIHATAHFMSVVTEPIEGTIKRIEQANEGPLLAHKRL